MSFGQNLLFTAPLGLFIAIFTLPSFNQQQEETAAQEYAHIFEGILPKDLPSGGRIEAPVVDKDILIFRVTPPTTISGVLTNAEFERLNFNATCAAGERMNRFFDKGGKLRFDVKNTNGEYIQGTARTTC